MQIDRRVTNGLAWAGVLLVVGVPTADLLSAQFMGDPQKPAQIAVVEEQAIAPIPAPLSQRPDAPAAQVAATPAKPTPVAPAATQTATVVDSFLQSGKPMPSYITGAPSAKPAQAAAPVTAPTPVPSQVAATPPARTPIATPEQPQQTDPVQVASIPAKVAPIPMPLSMRPKSVAVVPPTTFPVAVAPSNQPIVLPPALAPAPRTEVTAQDLDDWETGPLSDFLARRQQQQQAGVEQSYDAGGFFLDEVPNNVQQPRRDRLVGPADGFFY